MAITLQTTSYNIIYVLSRDSMPGLLKVGKTSVEAYDVAALAPCCETMAEAVRQRYKEAGTLAVTDLHLLYTEVAHFVDADGKANMFDDHEVHHVLTDSGFAKKEIPNEWGSPDEWFGTDLEHVKKAIAAVKKRQLVIDGPAGQHVPNCEIVFRKEQQAAIGQTLTHFALAGERKMLWNAKMRFGKTLCALELVNRMDLRQVLILTHRPTVRSGWFDDFRLIRFKSPFQYGAKGDKNLDVLQAALKLYGTHYIYFASMQDLRGHEHDTKEWKKNNRLVYSTHWDLNILDEAHEGTQTPLGKQVIADLQQKRKPRMLYLSGTPYNILPQFRTDEIFTWDYVMEQQAKAEWPNEHPHERNPYEGLARLHIFTYSLSEVFHNNPDYTKSDDEYFNFTEFFRTDHSRRVLYLISTRLPLMLFGAAIDSVGHTVDDLLSDRFIDDESWREFMPHGFTKALFRQVAHLVRIDVLVASAMQITRQTREADALPIEERTRRMAQIVASFHFPDKETVLTPWRVVNMHMTETLRNSTRRYSTTHISRWCATTP